MKMKDIKQKKFTALCSVSGYVNNDYQSKNYQQMDLTLEQIIKMSIRWKDNIDKLRAMEYHSKEQKEFKSLFPCWFVGGVFPYHKQSDDDILVKSNVLAIDIDYKDNPELDKDDLKKRLFDYPYTIMVSDSISGKGLYQLILVEDGTHTEEYYNYIKKLYKTNYNINVDGAAKNIGRKRFISYDDNLLIKPDDADIAEWKLREKTEVKEEPMQIDMFATKYKTTANNDKIDLLDRTIRYLVENGFSVEDFNGTEMYAIWYYVACDFKILPNGLEYFIRFSNNSSKYRDSTSAITKKFNNAKVGNLDDICRKYCGMMKNRYGKEWYKLI